MSNERIINARKAAIDLHLAVKNINFAGVAEALNNGADIDEKIDGVRAYRLARRLNPTAYRVGHCKETAEMLVQFLRYHGAKGSVQFDNNDDALQVLLKRYPVY